MLYIFLTIVGFGFINYRFSYGGLVVAVKCLNGIVIGADSCSSIGNKGSIIQNRNYNSIFQLDINHVICNIAGSSEFYRLMEDVHLEIAQYKADRGLVNQPQSSICTIALAGIIRRLVYSRYRTVHALLAGACGGCNEIYEILPGGSLIKQSIAAGGSGAETAYAVASIIFDNEVEIQGGIPLILKVLKHSIGQHHRTRGESKVWTLSSVGLQSVVI